MQYGDFVIVYFPYVVLMSIIYIFEKVSEGTQTIVVKATQENMAVLHLYHFLKWKYFQLSKQKFGPGKLIIECDYSNRFSFQFDDFIYYLIF